MFRKMARSMRRKAGFTVVEMVIILAVLVAGAFIFRGYIMEFIPTELSKIFNSGVDTLSNSEGIDSSSYSQGSNDPPVIVGE